MLSTLKFTSAAPSLKDVSNDLILTFRTAEPFVMVLIVRRPSSAPSEASSISACSAINSTDWSASFLPVKCISPILSLSAGELETLLNVKLGPEFAEASVQTIVNESPVAVVEIVIAEDVVIAPSTCNVDAISTAPSMSTTSKFVVPSTSTSPEISKFVKTEVPTAVILSLNVAAPASDISRVRAVICPPPSCPKNLISLSLTFETIAKSELPVAPIVPNSVPPSFNLISPPSASRMMSPATSSVRSPLDKSISVPSIVILSITTPALAVTTPVTPKVEAISTAPSISTTSRLDVPSISISPDISKAVPINVCVNVI